MIITKKFSVESAHRVRNCTSTRCSHSFHGHSYVIELSLEAEYLDNAQMVYDFGLFKGAISDFIDSMDHCIVFCGKDEESVKTFFKSHNDRWIEVPFNPSAEMLSVFIFKGVCEILDNTVYANGESPSIGVRSVTVHETSTGSAKCDGYDVFNLWKYSPVLRGGAIFSVGIQSEWHECTRDLFNNQQKVTNPIPEQQIDLS